MVLFSKESGIIQMDVDIARLDLLSNTDAAHPAPIGTKHYWPCERAPVQITFQEGFLHKWQEILDSLLVGG
jgi:hypothetical protein